ncbi:hypothetical protein [Actinacidiphila glaucinigra]|uniref:hypothetical protein n=1 Tax=Actinacidiphila glaucinigra TaxID=235986 RepID=UPI0038275E83
MKVERRLSSPECSGQFGLHGGVCGVKARGRCPHTPASAKGALGFASKPFERSLSEQGITLLRPSRKKEVLRPGEPMLKKVRQLIESVNDTLKGQLDLEQHGGRTVEGVAVRVAQRVLALAAAIWHNFQTGQAVSRSLTAFDH